MGKLAEGKHKIKYEFEKKERELDTKIAIAKSTAINRFRLEKIRAREKGLSKFRSEAYEQLETQSSEKSFLTKLIAQGLVMLLEDTVKVRCKMSDDAVVQGCILDASRTYA